MPKYYNTYAEAEQVRKRKQKQFPNFYVSIKRAKLGSKTKYYVTVK